MIFFVFLQFCGSSHRKTRVGTGHRTYIILFLCSKSLTVPGWLDSFLSYMNWQHALYINWLVYRLFI
jgi:hypothetical protein